MRELAFIGLTGVPEAGKDSVGKVFVEDFGGHRIALADPLRKVAEVLDPLVWVPLWGPVSRPMRLSKALGRWGWDRLKRMAPDVRRLLQRLGTEVGREMFGENFWVDLAWKKIEEIVRKTRLGTWDPNAQIVIVITDIRFPSEWRELSNRALGLAAEFSADHVAELWEITRHGYMPVNNHASENYQALWNLKTRTILNGNTVAHLRESVMANFERARNRMAVAHG